jgi:hypothetical protein
LLGELVHVDRREDPDRQRHRPGETDEDQTADEGVGDPAAGLAERDGRLREQVEVQSLDSLQED